MLKLVCMLFLLRTSFVVFSQASVANQYNAFFLLKQNGGLFNSSQSFLENVGQYSYTFEENKNLGAVLFGYEGLQMPVLLTTNGIVYLERKVKRRKEKKEEKQEEEERKNTRVLDGAITVQWLNANPNPEIVTEGEMPAYHTYGLLQKKAKAYKKITLKNLYLGIDVVYSFPNDEQKPGFEYSIIVHAGADISKVQLVYGGNLSSIKKAADGGLVLKSALGSFSESPPVYYYKEDEAGFVSDTIKQAIKGYTSVKKTTISFPFPEGYDKSKTLVIDPFVTTLGAFTGANTNLAYDIDFDYDGNIYVRGGGDDFIPCELAKYNQNGVLQWVFHGTLTTPSWIFGHAQGGWAVEKSTGNVYVGQGGTWDLSGFRIIRLNNAGLYDNYISTANPDFNENWKMLWVCNNGIPQLYAAGGGITSNLNLSICTPPSTTLASLNFTGVPAEIAQDIADMVVDPVDNSLYSITCTSNPRIPSLNNRLFRHLPPYTSGTIAWSAPTGYLNLVEAYNRPFTNTTGITAQNCLAVNASYLFYWDGEYLRAYSKTTGTAVGAETRILANVALMQAGIVADACDNVFVGDKNGTIKVYKFTGTVFDDAAAPDMTIPGFPGSTTYALAYDIGKKLIYACGQGYVTSFDVSGYCASQIYSVNVNADCTTGTVNAQLNPAPPVGSVTTYSLYNGTTFISSNNTGVFSTVPSNVNLTIRAAINVNCSGAQTEKDFMLQQPVITNTITTVATCTQNIGTITVDVSSGTSPYTYSINGINFQTNNVFTNLSVGSYTVTVKDANGCTISKPSVTVPLSGVNTVTVTAGANATICEGKNVQLAATSNASTFSWTPAIGLSNPSILNPVANPVQTTKYYITATSSPCSKTDSLIIFVNTAPVANAGNNITICFGKDAQLNGSGGILYNWTPVTYLDNPTIANPNVLQPKNNITYSLKVTDNNGCASLTNSTVIVTVKPPEKLFAGNDTSVAINQLLQLFAADVNNTGFINYTWTPAYGLNNTSIQSPVAVLDRNITYRVTAATAQNCVGTDTINIKVFKGPEIYVPNAFTPNGDGTNDILKALPIGLKKFKYFAVFNRYGERIFYTTDPSKGWDGKVNKKEQNTGGFTWVAEGVDYKDVAIMRKGSLLLIR